MRLKNFAVIGITLLLLVAFSSTVAAQSGTDATEIPVVTETVGPTASVGPTVTAVPDDSATAVVQPIQAPTTEPVTTLKVNPILQLLADFFDTIFGVPTVIPTVTTSPDASTTPAPDVVTETPDPNVTAAPTVDPNATLDPNAPTATVDPNALTATSAVTETAVPNLIEQISAYREQGIGFGVLVKLYAIAADAKSACDEAASTTAASDPAAQDGTAAEACTPVSVDQLVTEFKSGTGIGDLFNEYGKPGLLGVGHVRKELKYQESEQLSATLQATPAPQINANGNSNGKGNGNDNGKGNGGGNGGGKGPKK